ncbi:MAG: MBL fold metallo-hydrolase [Methanomicrobia archaeon]|nr:MBL fold metallo-hydrolase [Methanomicrobia archaeon]
MIHEYISYSFDSNVYVVEDSKTILIDAGTGMTDSLRRFITSFKIDLVVNTHCHIDHVGGDPENVPIAIGEKDADDLEKGTEKTVYDFLMPFFKGFKVSKRLKEGDTIETENYRLEVLHTPGHTEGSICLYDEAKKIIFSGDTLFIDGIGRTDLPSGDEKELKRSLERLADLEIEKVYPGHGESGECDINRIIEMWF